MTEEHDGLYEHENPKLLCHDSVRGLKETTKALLCSIDGVEAWIPKSQIDEESEVQAKDDEGKLIVTKWFAIEKGWYEEE